MLFAVAALTVYWSIQADRLPAWTGFDAYDGTQRPLAKMQWDWVGLFTVPLGIVVGTGGASMLAF